MAMSRKTLGLSSVTASVLVAAVLVVVNLVSTRFFGRVDLTEDKIYSLSEASRSVAVSLDDPLIARVYVTADLPPQIMVVRQYLLDLLSEYRAYGGGNFHFEVVSPSTPEEESEAQSYGIQPFQVNLREADKIEMKLVYLGLSFIHGDRQEVMPVITSPTGLEFELTSAIRRVTQRSLGNVGVLAGTAGPTLTQGLQQLQAAVSREYQIREVDLTTAPVPQDITTMIVAGPKAGLGDSALYHLDQYVMRGGPVLFLLDGAQPNMAADPQQGGGIAFPIGSNIDSLAQFYGAAPKPELVIDARHNPVRAMQNMGFIQIPVAVPFPLYVVGSGSGDPHVLADHLDRLDLLFVSPLEITPQSESRITVLARSSEKSGVRSLPTMARPPLEVPDADYNAPGQPLAVAIEGVLRSPYADTIKGALKLLGPAYDPEFQGTSPDARLIVVGDGDLVLDQGFSPSNRVFIMNALDWLAGNDALIALRSREVQDRPLDDLDAATRAQLKWANLFGPSLFVLAIGLVRWRRRVAAKNKG
jgi:gliding-associated putative ABC transporter substrate-binding component GldG